MNFRKKNVKSIADIIFLQLRPNSRFLYFCKFNRFYNFFYFDFLSLYANPNFILQLFSYSTYYYLYF